MHASPLLLFSLVAFLGSCGEPSNREGRFADYYCDELVRTLEAEQETYSQSGKLDVLSQSPSALLISERFGFCTLRIESKPQELVALRDEFAALAPKIARQYGTGAAVVADDLDRLLELVRTSGIRPAR
jgi:hypothetical protein